MPASAPFSAFGILCIQVYTYYTRYTNDAWTYKTLVGALWILEAAHQAFVGHVGWFYGVEKYGHPEVFLDKPLWSLSVQVAWGAFVGTIVKICFALRVWKFSKGNIPITLIIVSMTLAQFGLAIAFTADSFHTRLIQAERIKTIASASLAVGVATDMFTALSLSYFLHTMRTGYTASDTLINRLIMYSVNTGVVTSTM
ncbi:hypothetical protein OF83DRAFT_1175529 [Amylostereum chailletii]|nr:hypothetical protein OF83DRAFT_1175529 [Amylostereum chailletii]